MMFYYDSKMLPITKITHCNVSKSEKIWLYFSNRSCDYHNMKFLARHSHEPLIKHVSPALHNVVNTFPASPVLLLSKQVICVNPFISCALSTATDKSLTALLITYWAEPRSLQIQQRNIQEWESSQVKVIALDISGFEISVPDLLHFLIYLKFFCLDFVWKRERTLTF